MYFPFSLHIFHDTNSRDAAPGCEFEMKLWSSCQNVTVDLWSYLYLFYAQICSIDQVMAQVRVIQKSNYKSRDITMKSIYSSMTMMCKITTVSLFKETNKQSKRKEERTYIKSQETQMNDRLINSLSVNSTKTA